MRRFLLLMVGWWVCAVSSIAQTFTAQWHVNNLVGNIPITNILRVTLTPVASISTNSTLPDVPTLGSVDTNGAISFTNTVSGYSYVLQLDLPWKSIRQTNAFPTNLVGTVEAEPYAGFWPNKTTFAYLGTQTPTVIVTNAGGGGGGTITVSGDASGSGTSSIALTLATVATPSTSTKVTYDAKGRVTSGTALNASDIPNLDGSKITTGTVPSATTATTMAATGLTGQISPLSLNYTNFTPNTTNVYIAGSTTNGVNGHYVIKSTNAVTGEAVFTNTASSRLLVLNDPGVNATGTVWVIENVENDPNLLYYTATLDFNSPNWNPNTAPLSDVLDAEYGTNITVTPYTFLQYANYLINGGNRNTIWVDPINGDDTKASLTNYPYATLTAAVASPGLVGGGIINLKPGLYTNEATIIRVTTNVWINGYGAVFSGYAGIHLDSGDTLEGVRITNGIVSVDSAQGGNVAVSNVVIRDVYAHGLADGLEALTPVNLDVWNCDFGSPWDALMIFNTTTNSIIRLFNCKAEVVRSSAVDIPTGTHALGFSCTTGGKLQIYGGCYTVLNATNVTFSGNSIQGNAALMIGSSGFSLSTNFGNASVEIYGAKFEHGTTNSGATAVAIHNAAGIPISGYWIDTTNGGGTLQSSNAVAYLNGDGSKLTGISSGGSGGASTNVHTLTCASTVTVDASLANLFVMTANQNFTLTFSNPQSDMQRVTVRVLQDATGNRVMTLGGTIATGRSLTGATLSTNAAYSDYLAFVYNAGESKWDLVGTPDGYH